MKAQFILLFLLASVSGTGAFATNTEPDQEEKKTQKSKYDFNSAGLALFLIIASIF